MPVNHTVPTVGYVVKDQNAALLYNRDTYQTEEIWSVGRTIPNLKAAFIEASFPDELGELAENSKHLTPLLFFKKFQKLERSELSVYVYHLKPVFKTKIEVEISRLGIQQVGFRKDGQVLTL